MGVLITIIEQQIHPCPGPSKGFRGPGAKLPNEAPCVCDRSELKGQKVRKYVGTESGGTLRTF